MELRHIDTPPTPAEREAVDALLGPAVDEGPVGVREARARRHLLLPALHAVQDRVGWVSRGALGYVCRRLEVPPAEAFGVASFYALFALSERPATVLHLCDDLACMAAGAEGLCGDLTRAVGDAGTDAVVAGRRVQWHRSPCIGLCEQAPAALLTVAGETPVAQGHGGVGFDSLVAMLRDGGEPEPSSPPVPQKGAASLRLLRRVGVVDPTSLDDYRAHGGYQALGIAMERGAAWVLRELADAGLVGRGGAAFPTGRKWEAVARALRRPRYVVCNADESEPGTFKDRVLMEDDPFALVEAITLAGVTVGAERGYLYVRDEYPRARERVASAVERARARGLLGDDVLGRGVRFDIELRRGAGAYICGEETALFNSLEGFRGEPRSKPPFPVEAGLFGCPTVVNNVETLANVLDIVRGGAAAWRSVGTSGSPGTRLFCLSGRVERPGLYEHPLGVTLGEVIDAAGGVIGGRPLRAVLLGGAAGTFVGPDRLGMRLSFEDTRAAGATLGSGVALVLDDTVSLDALLARVARFFRDESCGQCVPCRVGTVRQEELVQRLVRAKPRGSVGDEHALLGELGQAMRDASICGLGQTASSAIESAVSLLGALNPNAGGGSGP